LNNLIYLLLGMVMLIDPTRLDLFSTWSTYSVLGMQNVDWAGSFRISAG